MPEMRVLKTHMDSGKVLRRPGDVLDVDDVRAQQMELRGIAERVDGTSQPQPAPRTMTIGAKEDPAPPPAPNTPDGVMLEAPLPDGQGYASTYEPGTKVDSTLTDSPPAKQRRIKRGG